jgi:hypothetical protein
VSLVVMSLLVAGGVLAGRWLAKAAGPGAEPDEGREGEGGSDGSGERAPAAGEAEAPPPGAGADRDAAPLAPRELLERFPCKLGDVVLRKTGDEAWLAGGLVFMEDAPVAAMFVAPDAGGDLGVYARPEPNPSLAWLAPVAAGDVLLGSEPPTALELQGERFERVRRLPVRVHRVGTGAPDVGESVILAEYASAAGERLVVVAGRGAAHAWRGHALEEGMYDVLGGERTLD